MNDKVVKIEFNVWADNDTEGAEVGRRIGQVIDWYGQRGVKITAQQLRDALAKWETNPLLQKGLVQYLK